MDKRFAVFDMDGTLTDSMGFWASLAEEFLTSQGLPAPSQELLDRVVPLTMLQTAEVFTQFYGFELTPQGVADRMMGMMEHHYRTDVPLKPGVFDYLQRLKAQGVQMGIASATAEPLVRICLQRLGVLDDFQFVLSCETLGIGKDRPDIYLRAAELLGAKPEEVAVYEDAIYAAETAKKAGFYLVGVYDDSASHSWARLQNLADEVILEY